MTQNELTQIGVAMEDCHRKALDIIYPNPYGFDLFVNELAEIKCFEPTYEPQTGTLFIAVPTDAIQKTVDGLEVYLNNMVAQV